MSRVVKVSRIQDTFKEDPDRFDVGKPKRKTHQMQPPQGPSSASPGPWLPETIVDAWMQAKKDPEKLALLPHLPEYKNAVTIRDSYRQYVVGPVVSPPVDDSPNFPMVEQPNVLVGKRWLESDVRTRSLHKLTQHAQEMELYEDAEHEGSLYRLNDDGEVEDTDDHQDRVEVDFINEDSEVEQDEVPEVESSESPVAVSDEKMDAVYRTWFSDPCYGNRQIWWETLHNFFSKKSSLARKDDDLREQGLSDDFQTEFMLKLVRIVDRIRVRGKVINQPAHYLTRTRNNCRKTALKKLTKENSNHPSILELRNAAGDPLDEVAPNHIDFAESERWRNGNNAEENAIDDQEAADEALLQQREGKLATLDPDLADVVGMRLTGLKQRQIEQKMNISQQAVSKKLIKATEQLQNMPDVLVSK